MNLLTVEETNLLSIYNTGGKRELIENVCLLYTSPSPRDRG